MPPSEDPDLTLFDMETFSFRGLDEEQTLDPSSLDFTKPLPASNNDNFLNNPEPTNSFVFHESYQEESLSDSSSSKRASSEASSKTGPMDSAMMNDISMEDGAFHNALNDQLFDTPNDQTFGTPPLEMESAFDEDEFMNQSFDFARASSSPSEVPKTQLVANGRSSKSRPHHKSRSVCCIVAPPRVLFFILFFISSLSPPYTPSSSPLFTLLAGVLFGG